MVDVVIAAVLSIQTMANVYFGPKEQPPLSVPIAYLARTVDLAYDDRRQQLYAVWQQSSTLSVTCFDSNAKAVITWTLTPGKLPVSIMHMSKGTICLVTHQAPGKLFELQEFKADGSVVGKLMTESLYQYDLSLDSLRAQKVRETLRKLGWRVDQRPTTMHPSSSDSLIEQYLVNAREIELARFDATKGYSVVALGWQRGFGPRVAVRSPDGAYQETDLASQLLRAVKDYHEGTSDVVVRGILAAEKFVAVGVESEGAKALPMVVWFSIDNYGLATAASIKSGYLARTLSKF